MTKFNPEDSEHQNVRMILDHFAERNPETVSYGTNWKRFEIFTVNREAGNHYDVSLRAALHGLTEQEIQLALLLSHPKTKRRTQSKPRRKPKHSTTSPHHHDEEKEPGALDDLRDGLHRAFGRAHH